MLVSLPTEKLLAFLTPIAFFRAINGSYELSHIRSLTYEAVLSDAEWQQCLALYGDNLSFEKNRNTKQKSAHTQLQAGLGKKIDVLRVIANKIPEIKDILLVNSYALGALKPTSDIDLLVITAPQTLWWARLKLTAALELAGIRRKPGHVEEQICLSFLVTENALDMSKIAIPNDIYLLYWTAQVIPLFATPRVSWWLSNQWLHQFLPNFPFPESAYSLPRKAHYISQLLNSAVQLPLKLRHQLKKKKLGKESSIIISDNMLKFHNEDRRALYRQKTDNELQFLLSQVVSHFK
ncbi:MAG: nucleotidyltransferase domain-containing protein [Candidatus Abawacabacteria bacterium]|nr:nucleotidyltransferase domain-containing protein [Candidatus Abawacabacteria bacterium]